MSGLLGAEQLQKLWMHVALNSMQVSLLLTLLSSIDPFQIHELKFKEKVIWELLETL